MTPWVRKEIPVPRKLNVGELKEWSRQVVEVAKLSMELQARGFKKYQIKDELRKKYRYKVIREAFTGIDTAWPVEACSDFLQKKFDGRTCPGRIIIAAGLKAGYNRKTVYRALLRTGARLKKRGKGSAWRFDWRYTERRPFLDEIKGHVGENEETPASKRKIDERGQTRTHSSDRATSIRKQPSPKMGSQRVREQRTSRGTVERRKPSLRKSREISE